MEGAKINDCLSKLKINNVENSKYIHGRLDSSFKEIYKPLSEQVKKSGLTLNGVLQAAYALAIQYYSDDLDEVLIGQIAADRPISLADAQTRVGLLMNNLPIRCCINEGMRFVDWVKELQSDMLKVFQYAASSEKEIKEWLKVDTSVPLFESTLVFENIPIDDDPFAGLPFRLESTSLESHPGYTLQLFVWPDKEFNFKFIYDLNEFNEERIGMFALTLKNILVRWLECSEVTNGELLGELEAGK